MFDYVGQPNKVQYTQNCGGAAQMQDFQYDALDRLEHARTYFGGEGAYEAGCSYVYSPDGNITSFAGSSRWYNDPDHPHAVTHIAGSLRREYDANGNTTRRHRPDGWQVLAYDAENRIESVTGPTNASFLYDAAGARVRRTVNGSTTLHLGETYE